MDLNYTIRAKKFRAKKSLGQNFLVDESIIDFISNNVNPNDEILEIGAGLGFVTEQLIKKAKKVVALEIDNDAVKILEKNLGHFENFYLVNEDILKTDINELPFEDKKIKIIANIPYYITSPILVHLLGEIDEINHKNRTRITKIIMMVQKEVAKRIVANEQSKEKRYGQLSILSQMYCDVEIIKNVPKKCFMPSPKVDSALVEFSVRNNPKVEVTRLLRKTVKAIFGARRKNIKNSLLNEGFSGVENALLKAGVKTTQRGEKLSIEKIKDIALALEEFNQ